MKKEEYCDVCHRIKSKCICKCNECKKLKSECTCKKEEAKEQTMADASGSYEAPMDGTILKKDIHKLFNFGESKKSLSEMDGIPAMTYDGPIGTNGPSSPMDKKKKKRKDPLSLDEKGDTASITAASTGDMISTKKGFPRFGGPEAKFVEIDKRCKTFPYCNQGADNQLKFISEIHGMKEAIKAAAKKYGLTVEQVERILIKESEQISEQLPRGIFDDPGNQKAFKSQIRAAEKARGFKVDDDDTEYYITTDEPINFKTRDEIDFEKFQLALKGASIRFQAGKRINKEEDIKPKEDEDIYAKEGEFDPEDNIFKNMK